MGGLNKMHQAKHYSIYHDEKRIYLKHNKCEQPFFTNYEPELYVLLTSSFLKFVYIQKKDEPNAVGKLLATALIGDKNLLVNLSHIIWAYFSLKMRRDNFAKVLSELREFFDKGFEIDHLNDDQKNNCIHNINMMYGGNNLSKHNKMSEIQLPYVFVTTSRPEFSFPTVYTHPNLKTL